MEFLNACWWMDHFNEAIARLAWDGEQALVVPETEDRFIYCYRAGSDLINLHLTCEDVFADDWQVVRRCSICRRWFAKRELEYVDEIPVCKECHKNQGECRWIS